MSLIRLETGSSSLEFITTINIVLPSDLNKRDKMKFLLLLHGYYGGSNDWLTSGNISSYADKYNLMIIMPEANNSYYTNMAYGPNYYDYVSTEIFEIITKTFNVVLSKDNTYVAGLSMGGYGALKVAINNPDKFKGVASLSGVCDIKRMYQSRIDSPRDKMLKGTFGDFKDIKVPDDLYLSVQENKLDNLDIFLICGKSDFLYEDNKAFNKYLSDLKIKHTFIINEGDHNWDYWRENIKTVLKHFFE
jgi:putative tributyrin esterase